MIRIDLTSGDYTSDRTGALSSAPSRQLKSDERVAVIIDEYYNPILDPIDNYIVYRDIIGSLTGFYGALKSCDPFEFYTPNRCDKVLQS